MSPEIAQMVGGKTAPPPEPPNAPGGAPSAAPMSTPQPAEGEKQNAYMQLSLAMDLLEKTLPALGSESPEGQTVLSCLSKLSTKFGHTRSKSQELIPAEIMQLMASQGMSPHGAPGPHGMPPGMPPGMPGMPGAMPPQGGAMPPGIH